jgi:hypothetical protein
MTTATRTASVAYAARTAPAGHDAECMCGPCVAADFDAALVSQGIDPRKYDDGRNGETVGAQRTRYATPGARSGRGIVRQASRAQVGKIRGLMRERDLTRLVRLPGSENVACMSFRGASDLIDRLLACPELPADQHQPDMEPATGPQRSYVASLIASRDPSRTMPDPLTRTAASALIEELKAIPPAPRATRPAGVGEGTYRRDGVIYRVVRAVHGSGHLYAKRAEVVTEATRDTTGNLVTPACIRWERAAGVYGRLTPADELSAEDAATLGRLYGVCFRCGRTLTEETSIAAGIGPRCAEKLGIDRGATPVFEVPESMTPAPVPVAEVPAFVSGWGAA